MFEFLLVVIFCISLAGLLHSYVVFPVLLRLLRGSKTNSTLVYSSSEMPLVTIVMAAYNEEKVMEDKLKSILETNFPVHQLEVLIGSDNSTDATDAIVRSYEDKNSFISLQRFNARTGKATIINNLVQKSKGEIIIVTDANVMFDTNTLTELVKHFKNEKTGLVDSHMVNKGMRKAGISNQEKTYIQTEVVTKQAEGIIWGSMMGPFGGCYAVRKKLYKPVPSHFLVDDFYVNMTVLEQGYACINEVNAVVYEDVSNDLMEEYRRKVRIATGNFQNLVNFKHLLLKDNGIGFCFFSHKVLRWLGPILVILLFLSSAIMSSRGSNGPFFHIIYPLAFCGLSTCFILLILDRLFNAAGIHLNVLRFNTHFFFMNAAMLAGMFKFMGGVSSGVWEPTRRNQ